MNREAFEHAVRAAGAILGEDEVLVPVAGILDVLDNYAFLRTTGYLPGPTDAYLSLGLVKKYSLRKGDHVVGAFDGGTRDVHGDAERTESMPVRRRNVNQRDI